MSPENIEKIIENHQLKMHDVPESLMRSLKNIPSQITLNQQETKRLIIWAAASCMLLLGMNIFAWSSTFKKQQSLEFTSAYFDYVTATP